MSSGLVFNIVVGARRLGARRRGGSLASGRRDRQGERLVARLLCASGTPGQPGPGRRGRCHRPRLRQAAGAALAAWWPCTLCEGHLKREAAHDAYFAQVSLISVACADLLYGSNGALAGRELKCSGCRCVVVSARSKSKAQAAGSEAGRVGAADQSGRLLGGRPNQPVYGCARRRQQGPSGPGRCRARQEGCRRALGGAGARRSTGTLLPIVQGK